MDSINMTNSPGLVSESCHESTFILIRHHNFNDVFFSVGATWKFNKYMYNNIKYNTFFKQWGSPIPFPTDGACVLSVIRFQDGGRRSAVVSAEALI
jgi:hypothetical protein